MYPKQIRAESGTFYRVLFFCPEERLCRITNSAVKSATASSKTNVSRPSGKSGGGIGSHIYASSVSKGGSFANNVIGTVAAGNIAELGFMRNSFVLYPKDLQKSHDKVAHRIRMKADAKMRRDFKKAYHDIAGQMDFEMGGMKIMYPATPDDIISEGNTLHHCVGGYVDRVARKECIILFLRQCADESSSFYTIEVREREIIQVRGMKNAAPTPEVEKFMRQWKKKVLEAPAMQQAA